MKRIGNVLWGIVFLIIGIVWVLNALDITNINVFFSGWWTLFIIIPSFIGLFKNNNKLSSFIFFMVGIILLLCAQGFLDFQLISKLIVPGILIIIGISFIFRDAISNSINKKIKELNKNDVQEYYATFSGQTINVSGEEFKGANLNAVFGGVELRLEQAKIEQDQIINASAIFGGIEIYLPLNVNVKVKSTPIFGGVSQKNTRSFQEGRPTVYINAFCMFGGADIK